jgi:hypothetical protein
MQWLTSNNWQHVYKNYHSFFKNCTLTINRRPNGSVVWVSPSHCHSHNLSKKVHGEWNSDIEELKKIASYSLVRCFIQHSGDAKAISDHIQLITWSIQNLTVWFVLKWYYHTQLSNPGWKYASHQIHAQCKLLYLKLDKIDSHVVLGTQ